MRRGRRSGLFTMVAVHSTARGPSLGGCRMWTYDDSRAAVRDVLRLSRAMTFKAAVAGLPLGGGKGVIMLRPDEARARRRSAAATPCCRTSATPSRRSAARYLTAEDVGTVGPRHGGDRRRAPSTSPAWRPAARATRARGPRWACEVAIRVTCERAFGTEDLTGRRVAVIGLGSVGGRLAEMLAEGGAAARRRRRRPAQARAGDALGAEWTDPLTAMTRRRRRPRAVRARRRAQRRHRAGAALPRDRRRRQQPARLPTRSTRRWPSAGSCGRPTSSATPAASSTSASSSSPRATTPERADDERARRRRHAAHDLRLARPSLQHRRRCGGAELGRERLARPVAGSSRELLHVRAQRAAANGRTAGGASAQAASSSSSSVSRARRRAPPAACARARARCAKYSSSLAAGSVDLVAVAGADPLEVERAQPAQPVEVLAQAAADEHAALAEHGVAGEGGAAGDEHEVVVGVAGDASTSNGPNVSPSAQRRRRCPASTAADALAQRRHRLARGRRASCVSAIPPAPPRAATSAATASTWASMRGPGSTTQAGSRPTTHVFVPTASADSGCGARMRAITAAPAGRPARPARWRRRGRWASSPNEESCSTRSARSVMLRARPGESTRGLEHAAAEVAVDVAPAPAPAGPGRG